MAKKTNAASGGLSVEDLMLPPDDFLADEPEGAAFCKAFQASGIAEFDCRYLAIFKGDRRVAVVPYFLHEFYINTMLPDGMLKKCLSRVKFRIACVGHPSADFGMIDGEVSEDVLSLVNTALRKKAPLIAYKGFAADLPLPGFTRASGLPVPVLTIAGDYYSGLSARRLDDFRRKLKKAEPLRFEEYDALPEHLLVQAFRLYLNTYEQSPIRFERLTPDYFRKTAGISKFTLCFEGETLIGFAQLIGKQRKMVGKYMGMDYECNRRYGLYFLLCLKAIEACAREGYTRLDLGVASYHFKQLLGSQLVETSIYYRHNNPLANWLLGKLKFLLEPSTEDLQ
ncbi:MAG TPA: GNAT family N-acetyltransferase [Gallionella sp.]|nr:GNAT family N-acetyltransferase [Gallionella sp.]